MMEGEIIGHRSAAEVIYSHNLDQETSDWAFKWYNRGRLRFDILSDKARLLETKLRHFVTKHEIGHLRIAQKFGWRILEFVTNGTGPALGWVKVLIPRLWDKEAVKAYTLFALGGVAATGSDKGASSDFKQADQAMKVIDFSSRRALINESRSNLPPSEVLDEDAWKYQQAA